MRTIERSEKEREDEKKTYFASEITANVYRLRLIVFVIFAQEKNPILLTCIAFFKSSGLHFFSSFPK